MGEVKNASKVFSLHISKNGISLIEKGKTEGGTEEGAHVLLGRPFHPPCEDVKGGNWLYRLEMRGMVWAEDTY